MKGLKLAALILLLTALPGQAERRNIIVMIADGWGYNHLQALEFWQGQPAVYQGGEWIRLAMATSMICEGGEVPPYGDGEFVGDHGYDPDQAWAQWTYALNFATDSAAAGTAMSTGEKTYEGAIGMGVGEGPEGPRESLTLVTERAQQLGLATGVVTSVMWSHATPACFGAHNISRENYDEIAQEMIQSDLLDLIMGAGHPYFDHSGQPRNPDPDDHAIWAYVGGHPLWQSIESGTAGGANPWTLIDSKPGFLALAQDPTPPARILGVAPVAQTLQFLRPDLPPYNDPTPPYAEPLLANQPSLATMTRGALNALSRDPQGFFLMVEGGALDWAAHARCLGRAMEELDDFNAAVQAVLDWVDARDQWDKTLVLITGDHETGFLWGPGVLLRYPDTWFAPLVDQGPGQMPEYAFYSSPAGPDADAGHSNSLVPFFVRGVGSDGFLAAADETDPRRGAFLHNGEMGRALFALLDEQVPAPEEPALPRGSYLLPNHPNPFNPRTSIPYLVPREGRVVLSLHDSRGRKLATLLDEDHAPGQYVHTLLAGDLPSGIYHCRLAGEGFRDSRKLLLLK